MTAKNKLHVENILILREKKIIFQKTAQNYFGDMLLIVYNSVNCSFLKNSRQHLCHTNSCSVTVRRQSNTRIMSMSSVQKGLKSAPKADFATVPQYTVLLCRYCGVPTN
jgi:hypothetical protein